ncbi:unnamed protein product [Lactuca saligna]|uniref:3-oxoacyl-[acyl-carrier-protein] reductase n=1 Tax=Lactuca saligna TaxID=75948 RepID=A0AA35ZM58_LACSI|nr:unnamed protein product [Lactuca saligna]
MAVSTQQIATSVAEPWRDLRGKTVMVTGASSGIGWELCIDLANAGCKIIAAARRTNKLKALCHEINNMQISNVHANEGDAITHDVLAVALELDICADGPTIEAAVQKAWSAFGCIHVLINNAGIRGPVESALDLSEVDWEKTFRTNLTGSWLVSKYVSRHMIAFNQGGSIINMSSISGLNCTQSPGSIAYSCSKSAFNIMTQVMSMELGNHKIRVNSICPGVFKSEITEALLQKKWLKDVVSKIIPLRNFGTTDPALTTLVRYLIHDSSNCITGNIFIVDAGTTLVSIPIFSSL